MKSAKSINKKKIVRNVFDQVHDKYDLMNDIMSLGTHRLWKKELMNSLKNHKNKIILDMASGTGDIAKLLCTDQNFKKIYRIDPNHLMLKKGSASFSRYQNIEEICALAENIPLKNSTIDTYVISFGIRNTFDPMLALREAYRITKKGGKFVCMEFFKVKKPLLKELYNTYSKIIPKIGEIVIGDKKPYEYLTQSIQKFYSQDEFKKMLEMNKFKNVNYVNLMGGIVSIHTAWKI
jgi:ubiquinone/menaquinone biosynthesis methyltransferase